MTSSIYLIAARCGLRASCATKCRNRRRFSAARSAGDANDTDAYYYANERFHQTLYAASHNEFLVEQATVLQRRLRPYRRLQLRVRNRVQRSFAEHESIVASVKAGDSAQVVASVRAHILVQGERFADLIATLSELPEPVAG